VAPLHHACTTSIICGRNDSTYFSSSISSLASLLTRATRRAVSYSEGGGVQVIGNTYTEIADSKEMVPLTYNDIKQETGNKI